MKLWRVAAETREYEATDITGAGAAKHPGRWNDYKEAVVYCAPTAAMAVLETAAHVDDSGLPFWFNSQIERDVEFLLQRILDI